MDENELAELKRRADDLEARVSLLTEQVKDLGKTVASARLSMEMLLDRLLEVEGAL